MDGQTCHDAETYLKMRIGALILKHGHGLMEKESFFDLSFLKSDLGVEGNLLLRDFTNQGTIHFLLATKRGSIRRYFRPSVR